MGVDPLALARALLRCPSVTPVEGGALGFVEATLRGAGFTTQRLAFSQDGMPDVDNLYARYGTASPHLVFAGHTDVVPAGEASRWTHDPFGGVVDNGMLYGRGACDMKGALAAMMAAVLRFIADYPSFPGSIGFLLTGDEEGPAVNGTVKLLEWAQRRGERFDDCVLGEPTNQETLGDTIKVGRRGSLTARLSVRGRQGHVAYPQRANNPIPGLMRLLKALIDKPLDSGSAHFEPSHLEITTVDVGNTAENVIPDKAHAQLNVRFNDRWTPQMLERELVERLEKAAANAVVYEIGFTRNSVSFLNEESRLVDLVAAAVEAETGRRPQFSTTGGTSDARFIKDYCPVVEFGLVGTTMHQIDEHVAVADLERLTAIYGRVLKVYFSPA